jgi:dolichol kinase
MAAKQPLLRTLFHLLGAVIPITYLAWGKGAALTLGAVIFLLLAVCDTLRLKGVFTPPSFVTRRLKEKEAKRPTGSLFYVGSCLLTILLFDRSTALASMCVLIVSDPLSSMIGSRWGGLVLCGKSLEGTAVFLFSAMIVITCFHFGTLAALGGACAATAAELFSTMFIDDNFSIPLACALALRFLS